MPNKYHINQMNKFKKNVEKTKNRTVGKAIERDR